MVSSICCQRYLLQYIKEALTDKKFYIDLTIPLFSVSIQEWYKRTGEKDTILFDSSEPFYANKDFMEHLRDMDVPETVVGYGKGKCTSSESRHVK